MPQHELHAFPIPRICRALQSALVRHEQGDMSDVAFYKLFQAALNDPREALSLALVELLPLPLGKLSDRAESEESKRAARFERDLPGLFSAFASLAARKRQSMALRASGAKEQGENASIASFMDRQNVLLGDLAAAYPLWHALLFHPNPVIRRAAIARLPRTGSPLSLALPALTQDPDSVVSHAARSALGMPPKQSWANYRPVGSEVRYSNADMQSKAARAAQGAAGEGADELAVALNPFLADPRAGVRYAAALQLPPDAPQWVFLAVDPSKRVRRLAAETLPLSSPLFAKLLQDEAPNVKRAAARRVGVAYDARPAQAGPTPRENELAEQAEKRARRAERAEMKERWREAQRIARQTDGSI